LKKYKYIIYCIRNTVNNKNYVGLTSLSLEQRLTRHFANAKAKVNPTSVLYKAIRKYGKGNFWWYILSVAKTKKQAINKEIAYIEKLNSKAPNGYNLTNGGDGAFGIKRTKRECAIIGLRSSKPIIRSDGEVFSSIREAAKKSKVIASNISACVYGKRATCGGFTWEFLDYDGIVYMTNLTNSAKRIQNKHRTIYPKRKVKCLTTGEKFDSLTEAAKRFSGTASSITRVCKGYRKSYKGLTFKYIK
jgi:hypothetical protein